MVLISAVTDAWASVVDPLIAVVALYGFAWIGDCLFTYTTGVFWMFWAWVWIYISTLHDEWNDNDGNGRSCYFVRTHPLSGSRPSPSWCLEVNQMSGCVSGFGCPSPSWCLDPLLQYLFKSCLVFWSKYSFKPPAALKVKLLDFFPFLYTQCA